jgi:aminoglycoside phosphotransferase (APT) family kinase protein
VATTILGGPGGSVTAAGLAAAVTAAVISELPVPVMILARPRAKLAPAIVSFPQMGQAVGVSWLPDPSPAAVAQALRSVAPHLSALPLDIPDVSGRAPQWQMTSAALGDDYIVKFAWSQEAARFIRHQIAVLGALAREPAVPYLPEVAAAGTDPLILVTRRVPGTSLFPVAGRIDRDAAGRQLARFLTALHGQDARRRVEAAAGPADAWYPPRTTSALRERFGRWVTPAQQRQVLGWCDWADEVLAEPGTRVLVHGDLHGDNMIWDRGRLQAVLDFENAGLGEPEYDLRAMPGPGLGPGLELLAALMRHYQRLSGRPLSAERVMAWHVRQVLGDVLWRREAGLPLADGGTPAQWVAGLAGRLDGLGDLAAQLSTTGERDTR